jgi:hypothetical protein
MWKQGKLPVKAWQKHSGGLVTSWDQKVELIKEVELPNLLPGIKKKVREEGEETHLEIQEEEVKEAI